MFYFRLKVVKPVKSPYSHRTGLCVHVSDGGKTLWWSCIAALGVQGRFLGRGDSRVSSLLQRWSIPSRCWERFCICRGHTLLLRGRFWGLGSLICAPSAAGDGAVPAISPVPPCSVALAAPALGYSGNSQRAGSTEQLNSAPCSGENALIEGEPERNLPAFIPMNGTDTHPCASWWGEGVWGWVGGIQEGRAGRCHREGSWGLCPRPIGIKEVLHSTACSQLKAVTKPLRRWGCAFLWDGRSCPE